MTHILLTELRIRYCSLRPLNVDVWVVPTNASISLRRINIINFVAEDGCFAQYLDSVCEPARYKQLLMVVLRQLNSDVLAECRT